MDGYIPEEMAHLACSSVNWGNEAQLCTASKCAVLSFSSFDRGKTRFEVEGVTWAHIPEKRSSGFTWPLLVCLGLQWAILFSHIVLTMSKQPKNGWLNSDVLSQYIVYRSIHTGIIVRIPSMTLYIHLNDWNNPYLWIIIVIWMWNGHHWTSLSALKGSWH